ncbi:MAG: NUDIX hydrolase [Candidatus Saccharimonadales bacterium]
MRKWKKISSIQLFSHPRHNVFEDEVELPSGHKTKYLHFGEHEDASCVIAIGDDGKIFVQQEYSYPPNEWLYQFPGGAFEKGDSPITCAERELAEEASMAGDLVELGWYYKNNRRTSAKFYVFKASNLSKRHAQKDIEEDFVDHWFTHEEINTMIVKGEILNYSFLAAWAMYNAHLTNA